MLLPPAIENHGKNICYASSTLHSLFNQEYFIHFLDFGRKHYLPTCNECQQGWSFVSLLILLTDYNNFTHQLKESTRQVSSCVISSLCEMRQKYSYGPSSGVLSSANLLSSMTCRS